MNVLKVTKEINIDEVLLKALDSMSEEPDSEIGSLLKDCVDHKCELELNGDKVIWLGDGLYVNHSNMLTGPEAIAQHWLISFLNHHYLSSKHLERNESMVSGTPEVKAYKNKLGVILLKRLFNLIDDEQYKQLLDGLPPKPQQLQLSRTLSEIAKMKREHIVKSSLLMELDMEFILFTES